MVGIPNHKDRASMEFPLKSSNMLLTFVLLGVGVLLGAVGSIHFSTQAWGYLANARQTKCPPATIIVTSKHVKQRHLEQDVKHNMSDEELLWRASMAPRRRGQPATHIPKIAFMFLTRGSLPLGPLWELYFKGYDDFFSIYIHALPGYTPDASTSSVFYGRNIPSQDAQWGEISICDAERRLLGNALLDSSNERFILLSETCIPLHNFSRTYFYITQSQHSFVSAIDDATIYGRGRYDVRMEPEVTIEQWRKGSQWFEVSRDLAIDIVADTKYYPKFRDYCKPHCYVDEHYIPTMLSIEKGAQLTNRTLTAADWSRGGAHPAMFGKEDINEEFISKLREYYFFARKYSPNALDPLLKLAPTVMGISVA